MKKQLLIYIFFLDAFPVSSDKIFFDFMMNDSMTTWCRFVFFYAAACCCYNTGIMIEELVLNKRKRLSGNTRETKSKVRSLDLDLDGH
jgi:hypothetical protein